MLPTALKATRQTRTLAHFTSPARSVEQRLADGKALRNKLPRERHAEYRPPSTRQDPVAILETQARTRLPALVPIRYARMLASPFAFLRGSAAVMAADLSRTPDTGLTVQACGDMHVANFGVFASAERNLVFGINDFDETHPGPWEWDLKRLTASAAVACKFLGGDKALCEESARAVVRSYRRHIREYAQMPYLDVWYSRLDEQRVLASLSAEAQAGTRRMIEKARGRGHLQVLEKMTELVGSQQRILEARPLIVREQRTADNKPLAPAIDELLTRYLASLPEDRRPLLSRYRLVDVARKVVGVGSVGTRCWVLLLTGNGADDPLFLQLKEAQASVLAPYVKAKQWPEEGERVVVGQRLIQGAPDIFLGWGTANGIRFYVRQLRDMKGGVEFDPAKVKVRNFPEYSKLCGWALAQAHAKSGPAAHIAGYVGKSEVLDDALSTFAMAYSRQTERDYDALKAAAKSKRIRVAKGK